MSKTNAKFFRPGKVPPGVVMHLTFAQADGRRHLLQPVKEWHKSASDNRRMGFTSKDYVFFKAGEEMVLEHKGKKLDAPLAAALREGEAPEPAAAPKADTADVEAKAFEKGRKAGRQELFAEVEAYTKAADAVDAAEAEFDVAKGAAADAAEADKAAAEAAVVTAGEKLTEAKKALADLGEVKP